jgi:hypothetical protein
MTSSGLRRIYFTNESESKIAMLWGFCKTFQAQLNQENEEGRHVPVRPAFVAP